MSEFLIFALVTITICFISIVLLRLKNKNLDNFFERVSAEDGINEPDYMKKHHYCAASYHKLFKKIFIKINIIIFICKT